MHTFFSVYFLAVDPFSSFRFCSGDRRKKEKQQKTATTTPPLYFVGWLRMSMHQIALHFFSCPLKTSLFSVQIDSRNSKKRTNPATLTLLHKYKCTGFSKQNKKRETVLKHYQTRHTAICMHFARETEIEIERMQQRKAEQPTKRPTECSIRLCKMQPHLQINYK